MQIRSKLTISTFVAVLLLLVLGSISFTLIYRLATITQRVVDAQQTVVKLTEIKAMTQNVLYLTELHIKFEDGVSMGLVAEKIEELEVQLQEALSGDGGILTETGDHTGMREFREIWRRFQKIRQQVVGLSDLFSSQIADKLLTDKGLHEYAKAQLILENRMSHYQSMVEKLGRRASAAEWASEILIAGFTLIIICVIVLGGLLMTRSITNPLLKLADYLRADSLNEKNEFEKEAFATDNELKTLVHSLEFQVQKRTEELLESNQRLEKEIDVRKHAEEAVKNRERKYRQIFNNTAAWMAYTSIDGDFIETNISLLEQIGYSEEELKQMNLKNLVPEQFHEDYDRFLYRLHQEGKADGLMTMVGRTGRVFVLDYQSNVITESDSHQRLAVHFAKDITRQEAAERAFQESELRFQNLVNALPLAYFITDSNRSLVFANRKTSETFQLGALSPDPFENDFLSFLVPEDRNKAVTDLAEKPQNQKNQWHLYNCRRDDGTVFPCEILSTPLNHITGKEQLQHILVDVSERLEKEQLLKQKEVAEAANTAISEWLNFVAHELRNPLGGIVSFANFGLQKLETVSKDKLCYYFDQIHTAGKRLEILLSDLLDLSKMEIGMMTLERKRNDFLRIVREIQQENETLLIEKDLQLRIEKPEDGSASLYVFCDYYRTGQVLRNLLSNAIKFTPPGRNITISFEKTVMEGRRDSNPSIDCIQVNISDEGIGIPEDQLELVFNKYKQSRKTRNGEGTGLGLPICKEIVNAHGGQIWVHSIENEGSVFSFTLPLGTDV